MKFVLVVPSLLLLFACATPPTPDPGPPLAVVDAAGVLNLPDGARIEGLLRAREVRLDEGATVTVTADTMLLASELILLEGTLVVADAAAVPGRVDAPSLQLVSEGGIVTLGKILGGRGADRRREDLLPRAGGRGTSILFEAEDALMFGEVRAGDGGAGWAGGKGGSGGGIYTVLRAPGSLDGAPFEGKIRAVADSSGQYSGAGGAAGGSGTRRIGAGSGGDAGDIDPDGIQRSFKALPSGVRALFDR